MKYSLFLGIGINLLFFLPIHSQTAGRILDSQRRAIGYANVTLLSLPDSTLIDGSISEEDGTFKLNNSLMPNKNLLRVSCIGYETLFLMQLPDNKEIILMEESIVLNEISVISQKSVFRSRGTDIIANIQNSPLRDFGTADDILGKIPMVSGNNGSYAVFGRGNADIYINHRKVSDLSELSRLQSKDIATIEVISNPGAKYDANAHAVIKINLKRNPDIGWGGIISVNDIQGRRNSDAELVQITYNAAKINSFVSFSNSSYRYSTDQTNKEHILSNNSVWNFHTDMPKWNSDYYNYNINGGLSVQINPNNTVGGQLSYSNETDKSSGASSSVITHGNELLENLLSEISSASHYRQWHSNIYYEGKVTPRFTINFNGDYLKRKSSGDRINKERGSLTSEHIARNNNNFTHDIYAGLLNFSYSFSERFSINWGTNISYVEDNKDYIGTDQGKENFKSSLHSEETKYAFFTEASLAIHKLSARLGLRYETFNMHYIDQITHKSLTDKTYNRFYPSLSLSLPIKRFKMGLSLATKVRRPSFYELRNSKEYFNRYEMEAGNPLLLPQYTTDLSYSLQYGNLRCSMDYQWIKDYVITNNIILQSDPLISLSQPYNYPHYSALSGNVSYNHTFGVWESYISANVMRTFLNIHSEDGTIINKQLPYAEVSFRNYFRLGRDWMPYVLINYNSNGNLREYHIREGFYMTLGVTKHLFNRSLYLRFSVNNIFGTKAHETRYSTGYTFEKERFKDNRSISLLLRYTFNNKKKYKGKSSAQDEIDRL